jgi:hypothetical protein
VLEDAQRPTRAQHPAGLRQGLVQLGDGAQHQASDHRVDGAVWGGQRLDGAVHHPDGRWRLPCRGQRDLEGSRRYNEQVLAAARALGERFYEGETLATLGLTSLLQRRPAQAEQEFRGALEVAWEAGDLASVAYCLDRLGQAAVTLGQARRGVILAAAFRQREAAGGGLTVHHLRWELEHPRDAARRVLPDAEIDLAWAQGRSLSRHDTVADAKQATSATREHRQADPGEGLLSVQQQLWRRRRAPRGSRCLLDGDDPHGPAPSDDRREHAAPQRGRRSASRSSGLRAD